MEILLTDEEIGLVLRRCDCSMIPSRHNVEEPNEHWEVAKAQLKKVVEYLKPYVFIREDAPHKSTIDPDIWEALLKECEE